MTILFIGLIVGVVYSLVAVTNMILTARYILVSGVFRGIAAGLGTSLAQLIWMLISVFGVKLFGYNPHTASESSMGSIYFIVPSSLLVFFMAYKILKSPMPKVNESMEKANAKAFSTLFFISMSRPIRIMGYTALFVLFGLHFQNFTSSMPEIELIVGGVLGVLAFWLGYVFLIYSLRNKITDQGIYRFSHISAVILIIMAILPVLSLMH